MQKQCIPRTHKNKQWSEWVTFEEYWYALEYKAPLISTSTNFLQSSRYVIILTTLVIITQCQSVNNEHFKLICNSVQLLLVASPRQVLMLSHRICWSTRLWCHASSTAIPFSLGHPSPPQTSSSENWMLALASSATCGSGPPILLAYSCLTSHSKAASVWLVTLKQVVRNHKWCVICCNIEHLNFSMQNRRPSNVNVIF